MANLEGNEGNEGLRATYWACKSVMPDDMSPPATSVIPSFSFVEYKGLLPQQIIFY